MVRFVLFFSLLAAPTWAGEQLQLKAKAWRNAVDLTWSPVEQAERYELYLAYVPGATHGGAFLVATKRATHLRVPVCGQGHVFFGIIARDSDGNVIAEHEVTALVQSVLLLAPVTDLDAVKIIPGEIVRMNWPSTGSPFYEVRRNRIGTWGSYDIIAYADTNTWDDPVVGDSASYWYDVENYP